MWVIIVGTLILILVYNISIYISVNGEEEYLKTNESLEIFSEVYVEGSSSAVLFIHGFGGSPFDFKDVVQRLSNSGVGVKVIILPGHGISPRKLESANKDQWLEKVFTSYDKLSERYDTISVVGFSLGGALAIHLAASREVHKLVVISPFFKLANRWYLPFSSVTLVRAISIFIPYIKKTRIGQINDPAGIAKYVSYLSLNLSYEVNTFSNH